MGSGVLLFSVALIIVELVEIRFPWRNFWLDWLTASGIVVPYIVVAAVLSGTELTLVQLGVIAPQILLSLVLFPIIARIVAMLDRFRLMRVRRID
jgi:rod shape-determining protein MreD